MARNLNVLIVDENEDSRVELRKLVGRAGLAVAGEARYGASALATADEVKPDAILLRIEEPVNRAIETTESLSRLLLETPIIAYSSLSHPDAMRRAVRAGVRDFLVRPFEAEALREAVFAALEQEEQRQLRRSGYADTTVRGTVIVVTGAKGGVGKSVTSISLALALKQMLGRSVALVDADTHFGDVGTMLNVAGDRSVTRTIAQAEQLDRASVIDQLLTHPSGLQVLPGPTEPEEWRQVSLTRLERVIHLLSETFDFVIVDTAYVFDQVLEQCVRDATLTMLVTSMDMSSIADTRQALRILSRWGCPPEKVRLTVNSTRAHDALTEKDIAESLHRPVFWSAPYDKRVPELAQLGESLILNQPNAPFSRSFRALAEAIAGVAQPPRSGPPLVRGLRAWIPARLGVMR